MLIQPARQVCGALRFKGDKSLSHRIVLLATINSGEITAFNLSDCEDVKTSIKAGESLGVTATRIENGLCLTGAGSHHSPERLCEIDCGNSGTTARLLAGILSGEPGNFRLTGDESLSRRPMQRVIEPLSNMGAVINGVDGKLPISIAGQPQLTAIQFDNHLSSAQVKSAILFAALKASGTTRIIEKVASRNHTELLFTHLGLPLIANGQEICLHGPARPSGNFEFNVPGDISSAAFFAIAAAMLPGSQLQLSDVLLNPGRIAFLKVLQRMGADIEIHEKNQRWEISGDVFIRGKNLRGTTIEKNEIPALIDELPALAVAMAFAQGESTVSGAAELRNKESDRITSLISQFQQAGINCCELSDGFSFAGSAIINGTPVMNPHADHRLAMSFAILALKSSNGIKLINHQCINISCPDFFSLLKSSISI